MRGLALELTNRIKRHPTILDLRRRRWRRRFAAKRVGNYFCGVYADFASATKDIPANWAVGYDNPEPAAMYRERARRIHSTDYPVLYWLRPLLAPDATVFDLGGHIGVSFYSYTMFLGLAADPDWLVCDVPAVVRAGAQLAREQDRPRLQFTSDRNGADGRLIMLASGSLQYIDEHLAAMLGPLRQRPPHLFVNMLPVNDDHEFVTLNNIGCAICPYVIHHRGRFFARLAELGYQLVDDWTNPAKNCSIPLYESHSRIQYIGAYLRLDPAPPHAAQQGRP